MSAPRPFETDPFHLQSSVHTLLSDHLLDIYKTVSMNSSMWYSHCVLEHYLPMPVTLISRFSAILKSFCPRCDTYIWCEIQQGAARRQLKSTQVHRNMA